MTAAALQVPLPQGEVKVRGSETLRHFRSFLIEALRLGVALLIAVAGGTALAGDLEPQLPKLEDLERHATPAAVAPSEPAQPMPSTVTICIDRIARRCWSAAGQNDCREGSADAGVYRVLENRADGGAGEALAACWADIGAR
jgi:hypothetical protein